jgi:hypothetical protein
LQRQLHRRFPFRRFVVVWRNDCSVNVCFLAIPHLPHRKVRRFFEGEVMSCHQTQKQMVLSHLRSRGSITTLIATKRYLCFRLSERVRELERDGFLIRHVPVEKNGRRYMSYSLVEGQRKAA